MTTILGIIFGLSAFGVTYLVMVALYVDDTRQTQRKYSLGMITLFIIVPVINTILVVGIIYFCLKKNFGQ